MSSPEPLAAPRQSQVPPDEALRTLSSAVKRVDAERAIAYGQLTTFRAAKQNHLAYHEKLLMVKLGKDNPRVIALQLERATIDGQLRDLQVAHVHAAIQIPDVEPSGYAVYGFIRTATRAPIANAMVAIYDANGRIRGDFNSATTNPDGYFKLITSQLAVENKTKDRDKNLSLSVPLELRISDANRRRLQYPPQAIDAVPGHADFKEVIISDPTPTGSTPPQQGRLAKSPESKFSSEIRTKLSTMEEQIRKTAPIRNPTMKKAVMPRGASPSTTRGSAKKRTKRK